jgi:Smg protein
MINDNILDVLTYMFDYLFEVVVDENNNINDIHDIDLKQHLKQVGFTKEKIDKAMSWLEDVAVLQNEKKTVFNTQGGLRIYSLEEQRKLGSKVMGLLMFMENSKQINSVQRESIIEQVMRLEQSSISMSDFKWVVMMVLGEDNGNIDEFSWFDTLSPNEGDILQ